MANAKPVKTSTLPKTTVPTKTIKGDREFEHDLFKLKVAKLKRNVSWKYLVTDIVEVEHCHFYHSIDEKGKAQQYCVSVAGHFHKIDVDWSEFGDDNRGPKVTVGPALEFKYVKLRGGGKRQVKRIVPVSFDRENPGTGEIIQIKDSHTHAVEYLDTEPISQTRRMHTRAPLLF